MLPSANVFVLVTVSMLASPLLASTETDSGIKVGLKSLRDLVNDAPSSLQDSKKKTKRYKCVLIEDGFEKDIDLNDSKKQQKKSRELLNKRKFVYLSREEDLNDAEIVYETRPPTNHVPTVTERPPLSMVEQPPTSPKPLSRSFQQAEGVEFEQISEVESVRDFDQFNDNRQFLTQMPSSRPALKQVVLPKAHGIPLKGRTNFPAAETTTIPPELATAKRDQQGRPLVLAPEHCSQIKHYANMYGVSDVQTWVHNNCSFAKTYLPQASCEEIDILVASCYRQS